MKWTKGLMIVPALFLSGCDESYVADYEKPYVTVCSTLYLDKLNERVNDYIAHGYTVIGNVALHRGDVCQTLERMNNDT